MEIKDWIYLFFNIICDGVFLFFLEKRYEKKQLILEEKKEYISIVKCKIDTALFYAAKFRSPERLNLSDEAIKFYINKLISACIDISDYCIQNSYILEKLFLYVDELNKYTKRINHIILFPACNLDSTNLTELLFINVDEDPNDTALLIRKLTVEVSHIFHLLSLMQMGCITYNV